MCDKDPYTPNFMDPMNPEFKGLHGATHFQKLRTIGVGAEVKHAGTISIEEENLLWECGVLGTGTPLALICSIFYHQRVGHVMQNVNIGSVSLNFFSPHPP